MCGKLEIQTFVLELPPTYDGGRRGYPNEAAGQLQGTGGSLFPGFTSQLETGNGGAAVRNLGEICGGKNPMEGESFHLKGRKDYWF